MFKGILKHTSPVTVPFSVSSGQRSVGCGETSSAAVSYSLPVGAREVNQTASWQNARDTKGNPAGAFPPREPCNRNGTTHRQ